MKVHTVLDLVMVTLACYVIGAIGLLIWAGTKLYEDLTESDVYPEPGDHFDEFNFGAV